MAMKFQIKNTAQQQTELKGPLSKKYLNMIIYGEPGAGKTYFAGGAEEHPETGHVFFIDIESGTITLDEKSVDYVTLEHFEDITEIFDFLKKYCHYRDIFFDPNANADSKRKARLQIAVLFGITDKTEALAFEPKNYQSVAIDSLTELQKINMVSLMIQVVENDPNRDPDVPSLREWGKSGEQVRKVVRAFRSLPMHTIFLALLQDQKDDKSGAVTSLPSLPGKLAREIPGFVDIVGFLQAKDDGGKFTNQLYTRPFGKHEMLKDRTNAIGAGMKMPTVGKIFDAWKSKNAKKAKAKEVKSPDPIKAEDVPGEPVGEKKVTTEEKK